MDFRSANTQPTHQPVPTAAAAPGKSPKKGPSASNIIRGGTVALLFCLTILVVAVIGIIAVTHNDNNAEQQKFVTSSGYQAVFLTNGQVYFGDISEISSDFIRLQNIYYLTQNTSTAANGQTTTDGNYTLVKLGCQQIHDPIDQMVIQRSQVSFWENLNSAGKVVTSIKQFQKENPKGPDCSQVSNQTQASGTSGSSTTGTGTTGTSTNTTTTNP